MGALGLGERLDLSCGAGDWIWGAGEAGPSAGGSSWVTILSASAVTTSSSSANACSEATTTSSWLAGGSISAVAVMVVAGSGSFPETSEIGSPDASGDCGRLAKSKRLQWKG